MILSFTLEAIHSISSSRIASEPDCTIDYGATTNGYVVFDTKMENSVAVYHGYNNAEDFKSAFGFGAGAVMARNTSTGEIFIGVICSEHRNFSGVWL